MMLGFVIDLLVDGAARIFAPVATLWRWLTADWHRMAFAVLIALCAVLAFLYWRADARADKWEVRAKAYEAASKAVKDADKGADAKGLDTAARTKGETDEDNKRARDAAAGSDDPLRAGLDCLRAEANCRRGQAAD